MASMKNHLLLPAAAVLLAVLAAAAAGAGAGDERCRPGQAIPHNPLTSCRTYVVARACGRGPRRPAMVKARCCRELAAVPAHCRCEALRILMDGERAAAGGGVVEGRLGDLRGCTREEQRGFAATLMTAAECDLRAGSGDAPAPCYWPMDDEGAKH